MKKITIFFTFFTIIFLDDFGHIFCLQFLHFGNFYHLKKLFWTIFTIPMTMIILETCGLWDIDYNWDPEFMTIFVTLQLRVTFAFAFAILAMFIRVMRLSLLYSPNKDTHRAEKLRLRYALFVRLSNFTSEQKNCTT